MRDRRELAAVFAGGAIGAVLRAWLGKVLVTDANAWPWATFVVNIVAAFALGWFSTVLLERLPVSRFRRPFVGTGICGGLSTFSTMQVETVRLVQDGYAVLACAYVLASLVAGLLVLHLATALARRTVVRP